MRVTQAPLLIFFRDPKIFYGELLFEEGIIIFLKKATQQGDFNDLSDNAKNRTGQWASKKGTNSMQSEPVECCCSMQELQKKCFELNGFEF